MAPQPPQPPPPSQEGRKKKDDKDDKDDRDDKDDKDNKNDKGEKGEKQPPPPRITPPIVPAANTSPETTMLSPLLPPGEGQRPTNVPGARPEEHVPGFARPPYTPPFPATATQSASTSAATPSTGGLVNPLLSTTLTTIGTSTQTPDQPPPDSNWSKGGANHAPLYAAAAVVPVVVLGILGFVAFLCLRRRKKRKADAASIAAEAQAKEMKLEAEEPKVRGEQTVRRYMAPPLQAALHSEEKDQPRSELRPTSLWSQNHPIILGPIGSGSNGAYLTGMDTSDMVSITSNSHRRADPFADNSSFAEPPPPYRPHSAAPPSFMSTSRQSSLRMSIARANSRARFVGRSPFDNPLDDAVSNLSEPTIERDDDSMSAVSRLSYQRDPTMGRYMR
ncbi:hypothetical protein P3342_006407 [Pyrenophora teres f. teres]|uniref:Uncharacterized protein n=2 Tax=Pyrenophora teres f. teres TaxID=97479 RepID=E3RH54_PYRTT|nr:hypothetical protein PTT_07213 [Pyrenophora teres f. teres 0-1]KAE8833188.1 hypothetical protein HRS9139_05007 [Pyrenophora teres f. teres]KAE8841043.1 hypothetical protein PTNB85_04442 [Pyrenophora teres f. teres]KAE8848819.1 hypothetical protein HRS9122_02835 [Pyrenophora teres f. teres]KAE8864540.1 hypothetical protein PTNB29_04504 [Pyrenophora teres f. teres]